jgi:hypothetical protein
MDEGQIRFRDRLKQPALLEEAVVLRVAHEGQVRVQHECEVTLHQTGIEPELGARAKFFSRGERFGN